VKIVVDGSRQMGLVRNTWLDGFRECMKSFGLS